MVVLLRVPPAPEGARASPLTHCGCRSQLHWRQLPRFATDPSFHVAGRARKIILQPNLGQTSITRPPNPVRSHQLALRAFDPVAMFHLLSKALCLLFPPSRLQRLVVFAHHNAPMLLLRPDSALPQRTIRAMRTPFKSIGYFAGGLFFQTAALSVFLARRTNGLALLHVNVEVFGGIATAVVIWGRSGRADQASPLCLHLRQFLRRHVRSIHIF